MLDEPAKCYFAAYRPETRREPFWSLSELYQRPEAFHDAVKILESEELLMILHQFDSYIGLFQPKSTRKSHVSDSYTDAMVTTH